MMERCPRQHRIGETCGAKLVHEDYIETRPEPCKVCLEIEVKKRRLAKVLENITRWTAERGRFTALLEKAEMERSQLFEKINELQSQRASVVYSMGQRGGQPVLPASSDSSYAWSSSSASSNRPLSNGGYSTNNASLGTTGSSGYRPAEHLSNPRGGNIAYRSHLSSGR